jgi:hypothetical protein
VKTACDCPDCEYFSKTNIVWATLILVTLVVVGAFDRCGRWLCGRNA